MKKIKIVSVLIAALMIVSLLAACGEGGGSGATEVVTAVKSKISFTTIEQGKLTTSDYTAATLYSDNTYMIITSNNTYYSSDGGETFNPTNDLEIIVYGKCEITDENTELGERTIKITSVDRVVSGDYDSTVKGDDLSENSFIGTELILTNTHELSDNVGFGPFLNLFYVSPY